MIFAGDAAHQVSPFGARGANSGVQDAENLAWKLAAVLAGRAPAGLIDSYETERGQAADENIRHSTRSTDFIAPRTATERHFRNAALALAGSAGFARAFVNSGRLSTATVYDTPLSTPDTAQFGGTAKLGAPMPDAPITNRNGEADWLLRQLIHNGTTVLYWDDGAHSAEVQRLAAAMGGTSLVSGQDFTDAGGVVAARLDAKPGSTWVIRPDQHLAGRFRHFDAARVADAMRRAATGIVAGG